MGDILDVVYQNLPTSSQVLATIGIPFAVFTGLVLGRFALLTRNYKRHNKLKPKVEGAKMYLSEVPRLKSTLTIAYWGDPNGSFEELIDQMLDSNGHAMPVSHHVHNFFLSITNKAGT
jgi:hypothetical protein